MNLGLLTAVYLIILGLLAFFLRLIWKKTQTPADRHRGNFIFALVGTAVLVSIAYGLVMWGI